MNEEEEVDEEADEVEVRSEADRLIDEAQALQDKFDTLRAQMEKQNRQDFMTKYAQEDAEYEKVSREVQKLLNMFAEENEKDPLFDDRARMKGAVRAVKLSLKLKQLHRFRRAAQLSLAAQAAARLLLARYAALGARHIYGRPNAEPPGPPPGRSLARRAARSGGQRLR